MLNKRMTIALCTSTLGIAISATSSFADAKEGTVTASALNVRSGPSTSEGVIHKLYKGTKVKILESSNGWYMVDISNGQAGWVSGSYISFNSSNESSVTTPSNGQKYNVTASTLNIRSGPGTSNSIVGKLYRGNQVEVLENSNGWSKIKLSNGSIGWSSSQYLSTGQPTQPKPEQSQGISASVTANTLNVRSGPSTSNGVIGKLYGGNKVEILENSNGWSKIKLSNGRIGWSSSQYLNTSQTNPTNPTTPENSTDNNGQNNNGESVNVENVNKVDAILNLAQAQIGKPYVWGATGPSSFDCSGLTTYVYKNAANISLPRVSRDQFKVGTPVFKSDLKAGDLIFSSTDGSGNITHVAIYAGDGMMIHSPRAGKNVEKISISNNYWNKAYVGARRIL